MRKSIGGFASDELVAKLRFGSLGEYTEAAARERNELLDYRLAKMSEGAALLSNGRGEFENRKTHRARLRKERRVKK